ncbi:hypothetical protein [Glycomyces salinus]|uniref:hypothetical protein n=1 Tax=Glycomyces salinus TaxID=980294 RepID=UPI0018EAA6DF|nr:hypothetical protein [Glycomyces salinus]
MTQQSPLKVDPLTNQLISEGAHFLRVSKKNFVDEAVRSYLEKRREEIHQGMVESMRVLDGTMASEVSLLTGLSPERLDELGGVRE